MYEYIYIEILTYVVRKSRSTVGPEISIEHPGYFNDPL